MVNFEIGNLYSKRDSKIGKVYYIAINHRTLITYKNGRFGEFTTNKEEYIGETDISVIELCDFWGISLKIFDQYMTKYFHPDDEAKQRARKEREEIEELSLVEL